MFVVCLVIKNLFIFKIILDYAKKILYKMDKL